MTIEHVKEIFRRLSSTERRGAAQADAAIKDTTVVGGQAAALWAVYYQVAGAAQMTTKDIDLLADRTTAAHFAKAYKLKLHEAWTPRVEISKYILAGV